MMDRSEVKAVLAQTEYGFLVDPADAYCFADGVMAAVDAAVAKERERWRSTLLAFVAHVEKHHHPDQHNPYSARELWPDLFAAADLLLGLSPETETNPAPAAPSLP